MQTLQPVQKLIKEVQDKFDFDLREYPVGTLLEKLKNGQYKLDDKADTLSTWQKSIFIESLLLDLPSSMIVSMRVLSDTAYGCHHEMVVGSELLQAVQEFVNDELTLTRLQDLTFLNGRKFSDLPLVTQCRLLRKSLRVTEYLFLPKSDKKRLRNRLLLKTSCMNTPQPRKG